MFLGGTYVKKNKQNQVLVEFAGISGVGKSTLAKEVISILSEKKVPTYDISYSGKRPKITPKNMWALMKVLYYTCLLKPVSVKAFIKLFKHIGIRELAVMKIKNKNGLHIFDEGIIKIAAFAVGDFSKIHNSVDFLNVCFKYIRKPDILIVLEADPKIIYKRRKKRNNIQENFDYKSIVERYNNDDFNNTLEIFKRDIKVLKLKHESEIEIKRNALKIVKILESYNSGK